MSKELEPCPWCGSVDIYVSIAEVCCPLQYTGHAKCRSCGAEEPEGSGLHDAREEVEREAMKAWSHRIAQPAQGEAVAIVDEDDSGLFVEILYGPDGSPLKLGDRLYTTPPATVLLSEHEKVKAELADALARLAKYESAEVVGYQYRHSAEERWIFSNAPVSYWESRALIPKPDVEV